MPTYQTTPYEPWVFPDEAYHMNRKGMQPLKPAPLKNSFELLPGGGSEAQTLFSNDARRMVYERLRVNKKKEEGMLGHGKMNERSQRPFRPASRSSMSNGVFHGSPMEYVTSAGLRGGVITTKEGQEWLAKRLKQRAQEYEEMASGTLKPGHAPKIDLNPYGDIDALLQGAFTSLTTGSFSSGLNDTLNRLLQSLIQAGATISPSQLTTYAQAIGKMVVTARSYNEANLQMSVPELGGELDTKKYFKLATIQKTLKVIDAAIKEIARVIYEPLSARQQVMSQLQSRLIARQLELYKPEEEGHEGEVPPLELGRRVPEGPLIPGPPEEPYPDLAELGERAGLGRRRAYGGRRKKYL